MRSHFLKGAALSELLLDPAQHPHEAGCIYDAGHCHSDAGLPAHYEYTDRGLCGPEYDSPKFQFALSRQNESGYLFPILLSNFTRPLLRYVFYRTLETGRSDYLVDNQIFVSLQIISSSIKEIYQVYLHSPLAEKSYVFSRGQYKRGSQITPAAGTSLPPGITFSIKPVHSSSTYGIRAAPLIVPKPVITVIRPILQIPSDKQIGTLALDITTDVIDSICAQLYSGNKEEVFLLAPDRTIIYGPERYSRGTKLMDRGQSPCSP